MDIEHDILARMGSPHPAPRADADGCAHLRSRPDGPAQPNLGDADRRPLELRLGQNIFFVNFEGMSVRTAEDVDRVRAPWKTAWRRSDKVAAIVNYDRFSIAPELIDDYTGMVKGLMDRHYSR